MRIKGYPGGSFWTGWTGFGLAGFAVAADPVEGEVISTPAPGLVESEGKIARGDFQIPIYEARPAAPGKVPVVLVLPEIFGMHAHIKDVTRRFAREGFRSITFEPYAREGRRPPSSRYGLRAGKRPNPTPK